MSSEKTEQPTPKKLRDARQKGQVAKSQDVTSALLTIGCFTTISIVFYAGVGKLKELILLPASFYGQPFDAAMSKVIYVMFTTIFYLSLPVLGVVIVLGIAGNFFQIGALLTFEPIKPELKKLNPLDKLKQMFSMKNLFEFLKSSVKVLLIGIVVWMVVQDSLGPLLMLPYGGKEAVFAALKPLLSSMAIAISLAYAAIAAADYFFQKWQHTKQLRMSKDEVKREYKEMEGNPEIKSKRKQLHQEMIMSDTTEKTRKATVLVTNPTHLAIALYYKEDEDQLPKVLAKGEGHVARRMVEVANEEGIPVMQHVPLAWALHESVDIGRYIPPDLIEPMAEVLIWVKEWHEKNPRSSSIR